MSSEKNQFPTIKWAQRKDKLFITINVVHTKKPTIDIEGKKMKYKGTDGKNNYSFEIELYDEIDKENSKYTLDARNIFLKLKKKTEGPYWPRLTSDKVKYHWIEVDWAYFTEEDEEEDAKEPQFDGQNFGDMGGEMDEDDKPDEEEDKKVDEEKKDEKKETKEMGTNTDEKKEENKEEKKEEKKADISDLDKEEE